MSNLSYTSAYRYLFIIIWVYEYNMLSVESQKGTIECYSEMLHSEPEGLFNVCGDNALLVLNGISLNSDSALLVLNGTFLYSDSALLALN